ncbi:MAG TPA: S-adenosylmethionine decarboxylase, partial [Ottowia sp.]|nr:S-adenosylmethionine decarboxylase [Ottowia sp.]
MRVLPHTDSPTPVVASGASLRSEHAVARMAPGLHLIGDLYGCRGDARLMTDAPTLEAFCKQAVADAGLTTVGSLFHSFG